MKTYQAPDLELIRFTAEDVIMASPTVPEPGPGETPVVIF